METLTFNTTLVIETCCNCGIKFGIPRTMYTARLEDHALFYCPSGHGQHYSGKTEAERLKEELRWKEQNLTYANNRINNLHEELTKSKYSIRALKAAKTKIINRVKHGVCPCCNRTFQNLQNHFKSVHPELLEKSIKTS